MKIIKRKDLQSLFPVRCLLCAGSNSSRGQFLHKITRVADVFPPKRRTEKILQNYSYIEVTFVKE
jgi:hypothetical protein